MEEIHEIVLSSMGHTWLLDLDGTLVKHNGYKLDGHDTWLPGALEFLRSIPAEDVVIFLTSRSSDVVKKTEEFLKEHGIRYNSIIGDLPYGERIVVNDCKPSGLETAISMNLNRDNACKLCIKINNEI